MKATKGIGRHPGTKNARHNRIAGKPSTRENMVIELTAASDFKRFITLLFQTLE
ncbi:hypothetical protein LNP25_19015 [Klebsiella variicola subsp. variicola]|nr:hypothetical protein [Klebsiella variicola subsp. variicola]